jgi:ketosteroid isomerase-like protein
MDETENTDQADSDVGVLLSLYAAFARGDIDAAIANLDSDIEWIEPDEFANGGLRRGPVAVGEYLRAARAQRDHLISEPRAQRYGENIVVIHHFHGRTIDGEEGEGTVADVLTVKDGRAVRMKAYADPSEAIRVEAKDEPFASPGTLRRPPYQRGAQQVRRPRGCPADPEHKVRRL